MVDRPSSAGPHRAGPDPLSWHCICMDSPATRRGHRRRGALVSPWRVLEPAGTIAGDAQREAALRGDPMSRARRGTLDPRGRLERVRRRLEHLHHISSLLALGTYPATRHPSPGSSDCSPVRGRPCRRALPIRTSKLRCRRWLVAELDRPAPRARMRACGHGAPRRVAWPPRLI
jgi:hypothetical protein